MMISYSQISSSVRPDIIITSHGDVKQPREAAVEQGCLSCLATTMVSVSFESLNFVCVCLLCRMFDRKRRVPWPARQLQSARSCSESHHMLGQYPYILRVRPDLLCQPEGPDMGGPALVLNSFV
eukprot:2178813-Rhodomonas_salina.1